MEEATQSHEQRFELRRGWEQGAVVDDLARDIPPDKERELAEECGARAAAGALLLLLLLLAGRGLVEGLQERRHDVLRVQHRGVGECPLQHDQQREQRPLLLLLFLLPALSVSKRVVVGKAALRQGLAAAAHKHDVEEGQQLAEKDGGEVCDGEKCGGGRPAELPQGRGVVDDAGGRAPVAVGRAEEDAEALEEVLAQLQLDEPCIDIAGCNC